MWRLLYIHILRSINTGKHSAYLFVPSPIVHMKNMRILNGNSLCGRCPSNNCCKWSHSEKGNTIPALLKRRMAWKKMFWESGVDNKCTQWQACMLALCFKSGLFIFLLKAERLLSVIRWPVYQCKWSAMIAWVSFAAPLEINCYLLMWRFHPFFLLMHWQGNNIIALQSLLLSEWNSLWAHEDLL